MSISRLPVLLLTLAISGTSFRVAAQGGSDPKMSHTPRFGITFERGEPLTGLDAPLVRMPFQCTSDGTVFISRIRLPDPSKELLTAVTPSRDVRVFSPDTVTDLYDQREIDHAVFDSGVAFLLEAAREDKTGKQTAVSPDGVSHDVKRNIAEHHIFIALFDRDGKPARVAQLEDGYRWQYFGVFPSGNFLVYGYDHLSHEPKLAILNSEGAIIKVLETEPGLLPESALTKGPTKDGPQAVIAPVQLLSQGPFIYILQERTAYPILEISEGGAVRAIHPRVPDGSSIDILVPSDHDLYARIGRPEDGQIVEIDPRDGAPRRRFQVVNDAAGDDVACVNQGRFLSFEPGEKGLIPLTGSPTSAKADSSPSSE